MRSFLACLLLASCGNASAPHAVTTPLPGRTLAPQFFLYTHCGIESVSIHGKRWVADPPLYDSEQRGNPPSGWDNPQQEGALVLTSDGRLEFVGTNGKTAFFRAARAGEQPLPCY